MQNKKINVEHKKKTNVFMESCLLTKMTNRGRIKWNREKKMLNREGIAKQMRKRRKDNGKLIRRLEVGGPKRKVQVQINRIHGQLHTVEGKNENKEPFPRYKKCQ